MSILFSPALHPHDCQFCFDTLHPPWLLNLFCPALSCNCQWYLDPLWLLIHFEPARVSMLFWPALHTTSHHPLVVLISNESYYKKYQFDPILFVLHTHLLAHLCTLFCVKLFWQIPTKMDYIPRRRCNLIHFCLSVIHHTSLRQTKCQYNINLKRIKIQLQ